jgi:ankyrin
LFVLSEGSANLHQDHNYNYTLRQRRSDETLRGSERQKVFVQAVVEGQLPRVRHFLNMGVDLDDTGSSDLMILHRAVLSGHQDVVQILLDAGADVNAMSDDFGTPLCLAALKGMAETVSILLKYKAKADATTKRVGAPLHCCILSLGDHMETLTVLMNAGAHLTTQATIDTRWLEVIFEWDGDDRTRMSSPQQVNGCIFYDATPAFVAVRCFRNELLTLLLPRDLNYAFRIQVREVVNGNHTRSTIPCIRELQPIEYRKTGTSSFRHTYLSSCAANGNLDGVKLLIAKGANIDLDHELVIAPLVTAARFGHTDIITLLLESGASVDKIGNEGHTALQCAASCGAPDVVRLLCERGATLDTVDDVGRTALHYAANRAKATDGHRQVVIVLCERGATVDTQTSGGLTALHYAAMSGHSDIACLLCEFGAAIDMQDDHGYAALHYATKDSTGEVVRLLCERRATVEIKSSSGLTALHLAAMGGHHRVSRMLCERGAMVDARDNDGCTPLWKAVSYSIMQPDLSCCNDDCHLLRVLVDAGADINARNDLGRTMLLMMLLTNDGIDLAVLDKLVETGADASARDHKGFSVLRSCFAKPFANAVITMIGGAMSFDEAINDRVYAELKPICHDLNDDRHREMMLTYYSAKNGSEDLRLVIALGADVDIESDEGGTALHTAARRDNCIAIDRLFAAGASLKSLDHKGRIPLAVAVKNQQTEAVRVLIRHGSNPRARGAGRGAQTAIAIATKQRNRTILGLLT